MLEAAGKIFDNMSDMMKKLKKASYEKRMEEFRQKNGGFFQEITDYMESNDDKEKAAQEIGDAFVERVKAAFGARGKIRSRTGADMDFFMIYYVFPALLLTESEYADQAAQAIRTSWNREFKKNINYTTYDRLYQSFREKIFGIF